MAKKEPLYPHVAKGKTVPGKLVERAMGYRAFSFREVEPIISDLEETLGSCWRTVEKLENLERAAPDESTRRTVRSLLDKVKEICPMIGPLYEESKWLARV